MILVDSNIPMYLVGGDHPHKADARLALERLVEQGQRLVTDAEVFQEVLHRYRAIDRPAAIQPAFDLLSELVDEVFPVSRAVVERARDALLARWRLSARDALHVGVMRQHGIDRILSFDQDFDLVPGIERLR